MGGGIVRLSPDTPAYAIVYPNGDNAFRQAPGDIPRLLIFTDRAAAESYEVPCQLVEQPLVSWHRLGIARGITLAVWHQGQRYELPPFVCGQGDRVEAVAL